jgi:2-iminobutanoate/2-iminopropanoate deaminase
MKHLIFTEGAPQVQGPYSQAIKAAGLLFVAGQIPLDPKTNEVPTQDARGQIELTLKHIGAILKAAGLGFEHVVKVEVFLKDLNDGKVLNEVYPFYFSHDPKPARVALEVSRLPRDVKVEISCIAAYP